MCLTAVMNFCTRYVISMALDQTLTLFIVLETIDKAFTKAKLVIWNSVQITNSPTRRISNDLKIIKFRPAWTGTCPG